MQAGLSHCWSHIPHCWKSHVVAQLLFSSSTDTYGPRREKTCLRGFANNKGADQPAHPRSLISAFVFRLLESIIFRLATSKLSIFYLVSVAEQAGLNLTFSETPKTGFLATRPNYIEHSTSIETPLESWTLICTRSKTQDVSQPNISTAVSK